MAGQHSRPPASHGSARDQAITAAEVMRTDLRSCNASSTIEEVVLAMRQAHCNFLPVTRARVPIGVVSEHSLVGALAENGWDLSQLTAEAVMEEPHTVPMTTTIADLVPLFDDAQGQLLVVDHNGLLMGLLSSAELTRNVSSGSLGPIVRQTLPAVGQIPEDRSFGKPGPSPGRTPAESARIADPTAEIKPAKSQKQPHPWDSPNGAQPGPLPLVTDSDLINPMLKVADVMTADPRTCSPVSSVLEAAAIFRDSGCGVIPITQAGEPVGVVTDRDVALALASYGAELPNTPVENVMTRDVVTVRNDAALDEALELLGTRGLRRLLVVDPGGRLVGILSWTRIVGHLSERGIGHVVGQILEHR